MSPWYKRWYGIVFITLASATFLGGFLNAIDSDPVVEVVAPVTTTTTQPTTTTTRPIPTTTVRVSSTSTVLDTRIIDERLLIAFLRDWSFEQSYWTVVDDMDDDEIVALGYAACGVLESGGTDEDVFVAIISSYPDMQDQTDMAFVYGAQVAALCPWFGDYDQ